MLYEDVRESLSSCVQFACSRVCPSPPPCVVPLNAVFPVHIGSILQQIVSIIAHAGLRQQ